jgi:mycothiol synthase
MRPASMEDVDAVTLLIEASEAAEDGEVEIDRQDVQSSWSRPSFDPASDAVIVLREDVPVAWAEVYLARRAEADVHPEHRGRGIGSDLLRWTEERAREAGGTLVGQTVTDNNTGAAELLRGSGYERRWTSWLLQIAMGAAPPMVAPPELITVRPFELGEDDDAVYRLVEEAFSEWPDREPESFQNWRASTVEHASFAPDLSRLAFDGDRVVGVALALDYGAENEGWVQQLAVDAAYRHRGIARSLLAGAFAAFHERGARRAGLSTDSRTGALDLYKKVGMRVRRSYTHWAKELT